MSDPYFVSTDWLAERLGQPGLAIIDGSWYLPTTGRVGAQEFLGGHIPGAVFFDIDAIADRTSGLPHMLPDPVAFASAMRQLGLGDGMQMVVYDGVGLFAAARVWWTLRTFGVTDVRILAGGLPKWKAEGRPLEEGQATIQPRHFTARLDHGAVVDAEMVQRAMARGVQLVDARPADRFRGEAAEPRPGLRRGHVPGSRNVPYTALIEEGQLKAGPALEQAFAAAGVDLTKPVIASCGSGVSAAIVNLALAALGRPAAGLYDGAWAEWGGRADLPIAMGEASSP
jgi:thiosulfate/3-mercaptopyruvate sulfurtransferase